MHNIAYTFLVYTAKRQPSQEEQQRGKHTACRTYTQIASEERPATAHIHRRARSKEYGWCIEQDVEHRGKLVAIGTYLILYLQHKVDSEQRHRRNEHTARHTILSRCVVLEEGEHDENCCQQCGKHKTGIL